MQTTHDGTHVVLEPLDFLSRLAALVPPPRQNLTRYYGVFATANKHRSRVMLNPNRSGSKAKHSKQNKGKARTSSKMSWSQRLARVFQIDVTQCPKCSGQMKIIACIKEPIVIKKILDHLDLQAPTNPLADQHADSARAPPQTEYDGWVD